MATPQVPAQGPGQKLSELRIVLLGGRNAGKSCVGNTLLCAEEFVTRERTTCLRRHAEVLGEHVIVTDTPGWWCDFQTCDTPAVVKREIVRSITLSLPGPNIFLLVIKLDSAFTEKRRRAVQEHLELLGEAAWCHTSVVFTKGEQSNGTTVEDHIKRGGKALQWVLDKCGNRYHAVDINSTNGHDIQKTASLLERIKKMIGASGGLYFEMEQHALQEVEDSRNESLLRAQQRLIRAKSQKSMLNGLTKTRDKLNFVLLGARGSGKSSVGNTIMSGQEEFDQKKRTACCVTKACSVAGRQVTLVDTPGWWMNYFAQDSPASMKQEMMRSVHLCPPGPHCVVLVVRVDKAFTETYARALHEHVELLGGEVWNHTIVVFSFGDWLGDTTIEHYIESEGRALQWLVKQCGNRYHVFNNKSKGDGFQVTVMLEKIEDMLVGNGGRHYKTDEKIFMELEKRRRTEEEQANDRLTTVRKQRKVLRSLVEVIKVPTDITITLLGGRHCGKSSTGNTILNREEFKVCGQDIDLVEIRGRVTERDVTIIKVPEWNSVNLKKYDVSKKLSLNSCGHGIILLVINCSSSFRNVEFQATVARLSVLGSPLWHRTMVLFTNGDWLGGTTIEQHIESEGEPLRKLIENCGNRYHVLNNKNRADRCQVSELMEKVEEMLVLLRLEDQKHKDAVDATLMRPIAGSEKLETNCGAGPNEDISVSYQTSPVESGEMFHPSSESAGVSDMVLAPHSADTLSGPADERCISPQWGYTVVSRGGSTSVVAQMHDGGQWVSANGRRRILVVNAPDWLCSGSSRGPAVSGGANGWSPASPDRGSAWLVITPVPQRQSQSHMLLGGENAVYCEQTTDRIASTSSPTNHYDQRDPKELVKSGSLQELIDDWGDSNIEELESFIDSYIEMFFKDSLESAITGQSSPDSSSSRSDKQMCVVEACHEVLSSIDRKLSKLGMLERMQRDLEELKRTSKQTASAVDLKDPGKQTADCSTVKQSEEQAGDNG